MVGVVVGERLPILVEHGFEAIVSCNEEKLIGWIEGCGRKIVGFVLELTSQERLWSIRGFLYRRPIALTKSVKGLEGSLIHLGCI